MIESIKKHLKNNYDTVYKLLKYVGYKEISRNGEEIRCAKRDGDNASSVRIKLNDYMSANDFSKAYKGDIIGLIGLHNNMTYGEVVNIIKLMIDKVIIEVTHEKGLFDGFFDEVQTTSFEYNLKTYPLSVLNKYESGWNVRFLKDNILPGTQIKFNLGYDYESGRITIPWYSPDGELLGVMGRLNFDGDSKYKYLPLIAFPKQFALYGLYQNKESIKESETVYIFESEKSVLQAHGYGYRNTVALGGNCIHSYQVCELLKLNVKKIILCFDEGLDLSIIKQSVKNIKECLVMRDIKIGILIDKENKYIKKGSKMSPTDQGKDIFENLLDECIIGGRK